MRSSGGFLERLGITIPVFQAGMGGVAGPELAAAVSRSGGGGIIGLYKHAHNEIAELCRQAADKTPRAFGVNFVPEVVSETVLNSNLDAVIDSPAKPFVTFFGLPPKSAADKVVSNGAVMIVQVGTVSDAITAHALGASAIVIQGVSAGGHHLGEDCLLKLLPSTRQALPAVPLFAAGALRGSKAGAMIGSGIIDGVLLGTPFICAEESAAHDTFKNLVVKADPLSTVVTDVFSVGWYSRPHRVLRNETTEYGRALPASFIGTTEIMGKRYPIPRFSAATPTVSTSGTIGEMALYCGESCARADQVRPAAEILSREAKELTPIH